MSYVIKDTGLAGFPRWWAGQGPSDWTRDPEKAITFTTTWGADAVAQWVGRTHECKPQVQALVDAKRAVLEADSRAERAQLLAFLDGSGPYRDKWFGERGPAGLSDRPSAYWWRNHLRRLFPEGNYSGGAPRVPEVSA